MKDSFSEHILPIIYIFFVLSSRNNQNLDDSILHFRFKCTCVFCVYGSYAPESTESCVQEDYFDTYLTIEIDQGQKLQCLLKVKEVLS